MQASIYTIEPFDANVGTTIRFAWSGNQAFGNRCIILDNETNEEIYNHYIDSFRLEHDIDLTQIIEGQSLTNGKKYIAFITVFDKDGNESELQSFGTLFLCLKTPEFAFSNVVQDQILASSKYNFQLSYSQEDGELLDSWQITIYDMTNNQLSTSSVKYDTDNIAYTFTGFTSKAQYKVRAFGSTVNGIQLDTGYIVFSVSYDMAAVFSMLDVTNIPENASILIHSNVISADGKAEFEPVTYINGQYVDLTNNSITYDEGFLLEDDFSLVLYAFNIKPNNPFFEFSAKDDSSFKGVVTYRVGYIDSYEWKGQLELRISSGVGSDYLCYSTTIPAISNDTLVGFCIVRKNGLYHIQIADLGTVVITTREEV